MEEEEEEGEIRSGEEIVAPMPSLSFFWGGTEFELHRRVLQHGVALMHGHSCRSARDSRSRSKTPEAKALEEKVWMVS